MAREVECTVCGLRKKPIGRDAAPAMANSLCDHECPGYRLPPYPGTLWPGEEEQTQTFTCPTCKSKGFEPSVLGNTRCTFCDGTEGGNPPDENP